MALIGNFTKQSGETLDYDIDASEWLSINDSVVTAVTTVTPTGLTIQNTYVLEAGTVVKVWLAGGTNGTTYKVQVVMTTEDGRIKESEFKLRVKDI